MIKQEIGMVTRNTLCLVIVVPSNEVAEMKFVLLCLLRVPCQWSNGYDAHPDSKTPGLNPYWDIIFLFINHYLLVLSCKHTKRQPPSSSFEVLTLGLMHENGSGTNFGASQCIPMGPCCCRLTLSVFIPLDMGTSGTTKRTYVPQNCLKAYILKSWDWDWNTL